MQSLRFYCFGFSVKGCKQLAIPRPRNKSLDAKPDTAPQVTMRMISATRHRDTHMCRPQLIVKHIGDHDATASKTWTKGEIGLARKKA